MLGACRLDVDVAVTVADDGSGTVTVTLVLDAEATAARPDLASLVRVDDLVAAGWDVVGPTAGAGGETTLRLQRSFATPAELAATLAEVGGGAGGAGENGAGESGLFRDVVLDRSDRFAETRYAFSVTVDTGAGVEAFVDDGVLAVTGADPLGDVEARVGAPLEELVGLSVSASLPGTVRAPGGRIESGTARWTPLVGSAEPVELAATGVVSRGERTAYLAGAAVSGAVLVVLLVRLGWRRRRRTVDAGA